MNIATRILIVEGNAALSQSAATYFRDTGWAPFIARDPGQAMATGKDLRPDVIVLNSNLPGGGMQTLTRLKSNIKTANIPVVTITGMPEIYQNAGAHTCTPDMADFDAVKQAALSCLAKPVVVEQPPQVTIQDPARLAALHESGMLDSPPEPMLDAITQLAARLVNVPTALISLVDVDRQFFKSQVGLSAPWATERQTKLSHSFCQWVVSGNEPLLVEDARAHPVLHRNLAVRDLGVISYLGVPMQTSGQPIGSLCVIDSKPHQWSDADLQTLRELACIVETFTPPLLPKVTHSLDITAKALSAVQSLLNNTRYQLDKQERELLWQSVSRLGRQLTTLA